MSLLWSQSLGATQKHPHTITHNTRNYALIDFCYKKNLLLMRAPVKCQITAELKLILNIKLCLSAKGFPRKINLGGHRIFYLPYISNYVYRISTNCSKNILFLFAKHGFGRKTFPGLELNLSMKATKHWSQATYASLRCQYKSWQLHHHQQC